MTSLEIKFLHMPIQTRMESNVCILKPEGKLSMGFKDFDLRAAVREQIEAGQLFFIINLGGIQSMDSSGLGELVHIEKWISKHKGKVRFCDVKPQFSRLLEITELNFVLEVFNDEKQALVNYP